MQSIREVFSRLHLCRHTFASLWGACLRFASLWPANSRGDSCVLDVHLSNVCRGLLFCLRIAWDHALSLLSLYFSLSSQRNKEAKKIVPDLRLVSVKRSSFKRVLNLRKAYIFKSLLKVYYRSVFSWIFQSVHLSKVCWNFTPWGKFYFRSSLHIFLWKMRATPGACIKSGCLARRPLCHKVNLPASCEAQRLLCHKVNLLSCVAR